MMRVHLLDPPAYSPAYDAALASALARHEVSVRLLTSGFAYGDVPQARDYARHEFFYRRTIGRPGSRLRTAGKLAQHLPDMLRYQRLGAADVSHVQWLTLPRLDLRLLPERPTVLTIHDPLERAGPLGPIPAREFARVDAVVVHSQYARERVIAEHRLQPSRIHVIRHGALGPETLVPESLGPESLGPESYDAARRWPEPQLRRPPRPPHELRDDGSPVVLCFGLIRPYKGIETLLGAWRGITGAQLWIVGRPMMDLGRLWAAAPAGVQIVPRFVGHEQERALFARADIVALPYARSDRFGFSGVLATAIGFGRAIVASDIGGFRELGEEGVAELVPPGDVAALHDALSRLLNDGDARTELAAAAADAATTTYSWDQIATQTLDLYRSIARG